MIITADNLQITNKTIEKALEEKLPEPIIKMVRRCEKAGAQAIDINSGPLGRHPEETMQFLVNTVQGVSELPILIDTANPVAMEAGLSVCKNPVTINGFSLEPKKIERILPLAKKYNADIIGYLLYSNSHVPQDMTERLNIASEILEISQAAGIGTEKLIIDPVLVPLSWQNGKTQAFEVLEVIRHLPELLGFPVRTIIGLSNLTTGRGYKEKRLLFEKTYLPMLSAAGLDMVLLNIFHDETVEVAKACNRLKDDKIFSWEGF